MLDADRDCTATHALNKPTLLPFTYVDPAGFTRGFEYTECWPEGGALVFATPTGELRMTRAGLGLHKEKQANE